MPPGPVPVEVNGQTLPRDLDALMPEAGLGFALKLQRAGIDTPADLLAMTRAELAHSGGIGPANAAKVVRELAKGPWRLAEPAARGAPPGRGPPGRLAPAAERYGAARARLAARAAEADPPADTRPDAIDTPFSEVP